jgi:hypothetical protein
MWPFIIDNAPELKNLSTTSTLYIWSLGRPSDLTLRPPLLDRSIRQRCVRNLKDTLVSCSGTCLWLE